MVERRKSPFSSVPWKACPLVSSCTGILKVMYLAECSLYSEWIQSICIKPDFSFSSAKCCRLHNNLFLNWFIIIEKWFFTPNSCIRMLTIQVYIYAARKNEHKLNFKLLMFSHSNISCSALFVTGTVLHPKLFCLMIKPCVYEACTFFISFMTLSSTSGFCEGILTIGSTWQTYMISMLW